MRRRASVPILAALVCLVVLAPVLPGAADEPDRAEGDATARGDRAPVACAEQVARRVQARYESIRNLKARFEQVTRSVSFGSGTLAGDAPVSG